MNQDYHIFQGMRQDNPPIRQEAKFLWDAYNIRLTNRGDNSIFSISNEKGNTNILTLDDYYVGHCVIGEYLIIFTVVKGTLAPGVERKTNIYRIDKNFKVKTLVSTPLNMQTTPIETLGVYEGEFVQKVYWVDGINQPRVINIVADKLAVNLGEVQTEEEYKYPEGCFDFIRSVNLNENITITRGEGNGSFAPGIIQYAFSYYNKYGQESNIIYTSELLYISYNDRGASEEDNISNIFEIQADTLDTNFEYLRVYSIHRTSLDATPTVKIVTDIEITHNSTISYIDNGLSGSTIEPTRLLYIGGETIAASTLTQKDNTLFLGNIKMLRKEISSAIKESLKGAVENGRINYKLRKLALIDNYDTSGTIYRWQSQLQANGGIAAYKTGETYRLGIQLQEDTGKWTEPIWIGDYEVPQKANNRPYLEYSIPFVPSMSFSLTTEEVIALLSSGYKRVRGVVVLPSIYDRMILAQGVLCPTVFSVKDRVSNSPFAQSSWFFRPMTALDDSATINNTDIMKGSVLAFKNLEPLRRGAKFMGSTDYHVDRGGEIQNMRYGTFKEINNIAVDGTTINTFFVDQNILTFHSPDIEFDNSTLLALNNNSFELDIVGIAPIVSNAGDITIQTSTPTPTSDDSGFIHKALTNTNSSCRSLVSGMFYNSHIIQATKNAESFSAYEGHSDTSEKVITSVSWMIYPWQRSGSLNNDCVRPSGKGTRTSVLKRKVISNLKFSEDNSWFDTQWKPSMGITPVSIFNSNEVSLIKVPAPLNSGIESINYYGNVDTLITTDKGYTFPMSSLKEWGIGVNKGNPFTVTETEDISTPVYQYANQLGWTTEPVRMKYKSSPHAVFALNYKDGNIPIVLPDFRGINTSIDLGEIGLPFWVEQNKKKSLVIDNYLSINYFIDDSTIIDAIQNTTLSIKEKTTIICNSLKKVCRPPEYKEGDYIITFSSASEEIGTYFDIYKATAYVEEGIAIEWYRVNYINYKYCKYVGINTIYINQNDYLEEYYLPSSLDVPVFRKIKNDEIFNVSQDTINTTTSRPASNGLYIAELRRKKIPLNRFGGNTPEALRNNLWLPAGKPTPITENTTIDFIYGDTFYQRYDCLKTYSFTDVDENSVVDIGSFMCETKVNLDGRYDRNRGQSNNLNMSPTNFNLINNVYSQKDNFFNYRIFDKSYYYSKQYSSQLTWSLQKNNLEDIDTWTNVTLANSLDLDRSNGALTSLQVYNELVLAFQEKGINQILFNSRVQIPTSDGVPIEISNNYKVDGSRIISDTIGCQSNTYITKSPLGLYFVDTNTDSFYLFNGQINDLGTKCGGTYWFKHNHEYFKDYLRLSYDPKYKDVYIHAPVEALCYSEQLGQFTSRMSYGYTTMIYFNNESISYDITDTSNNTRLWKNFAGDYNSLFGKPVLPYFTYITNDNPTYTKIFDTIEYRANFYSNGDYVSNKSFDWIKVKNDYQDTGNKPLTQSRSYVYKDNSSLRHKFRIWRAQIPREQNSRNRIRDLWSSITLGFNDTNNTNFKFELSDISTKYTI